MRSYDILTVSQWFADIETLRHAFGSEAEESALREMAGRYQAEMDSQRHYIFTLETLDHKAFGFVRYSLHRDPDAPRGRNRVARIGILIGEKRFWGKGWGSEAIATFVEYLFGQKGVDRIELDTAHFNHRAQKCFQKCGFRSGPPPANYFSISNDPTPKIWMGLSRSTWESMQTAH